MSTTGPRAAAAAARLAGSKVSALTSLSIVAPASKAAVITAARRVSIDTA